MIKAFDVLLIVTAIAIAALLTLAAMPRARGPVVAPRAMGEHNGTARDKLLVVQTVIEANKWHRPT